MFCVLSQLAKKCDSSKVVVANFATTENRNLHILQSANLRFQFGTSKENGVVENEGGVKANEYTVDYIVSHCAASSTVAFVGHGLFELDSLNAYLEEIRQKTNFKKWFFGHYHENRNVNVQEILIYEQIIRIG